MKNKLALMVVVLTVLYVARGNIRDLMLAWEKSRLPEEVTSIPSPSSQVSISPASSSGINLAVQFSSQAPFGDWNLPYQEACEETSALLVNSFHQGTSLTPYSVRDEINDLVAWQQRNFGYYKHTTAQETAQMLKGFYKYTRVDVEQNATIASIKRHVQAGRPVIVPLAGRLLGNRYYTHPGPVYHMLVVKGFAKNGDVITNDVGTSRGHNYIYSPEVFLNAMHDVPSGGDEWPVGVDSESYILTGGRAIVVVYPNK